jgi:hypothetical protein
MSIPWKRIELACKTADLIASDRKVYGRDGGNAATYKQRVEACAKAIADGLKRISAILTIAGY